MSNFFSLQHKFINKEMFKEIEYQMSKIVNLSKIKKINAIHFLEIIKKDKKNRKNQIRLILTKGYGKMFIKNFSRDLIFISMLKKYFVYIANLKMTSLEARSNSR